ncbi:GNAT family N-acetyltransferase [Paraclostridium bifermentans]|nr:GNAT family N-acetyltransferase [Paraclostridium bifermentans]
MCKDNLPIVIGDKLYHNKGIGKSVLRSLILRARELELECINVQEIYDYNICSQKLFESFGF